MSEQPMNDDEDLTGVVAVPHARRVLFTGAEEAAEREALRQENAALKERLRLTTENSPLAYRLHGQRWQVFERGTLVHIAFVDEERDAENIVQAASGGQAGSAWVSVEERLPDNSRDVLVVVAGRRKIGRYYTKEPQNGK